MEWVEVDLVEATTEIGADEKFDTFQLGLEENGAEGGGGVRVDGEVFKVVDLLCWRRRSVVFAMGGW